MLTKIERKKEAEESARQVARLLADVQPADLSEAQWCEQASVSPSFFSNLRGTPSKPPSDPSISNLKRLLKVADVTLPEFFLSEGRGRIFLVPDPQVLEQVLAVALDAMPRRVSERPAFVASIVQHALALPGSLRASSATVESSAPGDTEADAPARVASSRG